MIKPYVASFVISRHENMNRQYIYGAMVPSQSISLHTRSMILLYTMQDAKAGVNACFLDWHRHLLQPIYPLWCNLLTIITQCVCFQSISSCTISFGKSKLEKDVLSRIDTVQCLQAPYRNQGVCMWHGCGNQNTAFMQERYLYLWNRQWQLLFSGWKT